MGKCLYKNEPGFKVKLTDLILKKDVNGCYYLGAKYLIEDDNAVRELHIPRMFLNISLDSVIVKDEFNPGKNPEADIGFGYLPIVCEDPRNMVYYSISTIKEKPHEMTLEEIEKKLGYKVKIVSKQEEK